MRSNHFQWSESRVYKNEILHPHFFSSLAKWYLVAWIHTHALARHRHRCAIVIAATFVTLESIFELDFTSISKHVSLMQ